jgi:hypothetical protein
MDELNPLVIQLRFSASPCGSARGPDSASTVQYCYRTRGAIGKERDVTSTTWLPYLGVSELLLGPAILAAAIAAGRTSPRRTIIVLTSGAFVLLVAGVVGCVTHLEPLREVSFTLSLFDVNDLQTTVVSAGDAVLVSLANGALLIGAVLSFGASVLALDRAAQQNNWGWFVGLGVFALIGGVADVAAFNQLAELSLGATMRSAIGDALTGPLGRFGSFGEPEPSYLVWSVLVSIAPVLAFLYACRVPNASYEANEAMRCMTRRTTPIFNSE